MSIEDKKKKGLAQIMNNKPLDDLVGFDLDLDPDLIVVDGEVDKTLEETFQM